MGLCAGTVLAERYRLMALLGEGGMGEVWAARHLLTGKAVAVKQLTCGAHERHFREARARFAREAKSACAVDHPNVVEIFDFLESAERAPIMVMELLQGETLAARLARGSLSARELARTLLPVVSAVGTAHARGIVHRDLKPSNIFLDVRPQDGTERVKVLDFGIAKWLAFDGEDHGLRTRTGSTLGTPSYMAPEQATGDRTADHRVDIWSLGVILYEASSGVRPLEGENSAQLVMRLLSSGIMPIEQLVPDLPPELAALIGRMLARDVTRRPADLREVYALLCRLAGEDSVPFGPPARVEPGDANPVFAGALFDAPARADVDALAPTLEPAGSSAAIVRHAALKLPTRTALLVPDALVALETQALALPAADRALPALRAPWARPLLLAALGMAALVSLVLVLGTRSEDPTRAVVAAPTASAPSANDALPIVVVSSLPLEAAPSAAPSGPETPHASKTTHASKTRASRDRRRPRPTARRPRSVAPSPITAPGSQHDGAPAHEGATSTAAPSAAPTRTRPRGAECETSSECESRLCVAYTCQ